MTEHLCRFIGWILEASIWDQFRLVPAQAPTSGDIFSFSEYLAALALLLVVMVASDFRSLYRLSLARFDVRKVGFWVGLTVGIAILTIDIWFQNGLPIPKLLGHSNNLKVLLGFIFLAFVFSAISIAVVRPPVFGKKNSMRFLDVNYRLIHQGNADQTQIIAEELRRSLPEIIRLAAEMPIKRNGVQSESPKWVIDAHHLLLLFADRRFCRIVVARVPSFALALIEQAQVFPLKRVPIYIFIRNTGQEFIRNTNSSYYQEQSWFESGLFGHERPITNLLFGSYEFIDRCAREGGSPLDMDYRDLREFDQVQVGGFTRASLAFLENYLRETKGRYHSQALVGILRSFEGLLSRTYEIEGLEEYRDSRAYWHLDAVASFIEDAIQLVGKHAEIPRTFRPPGVASRGIFDELARLIVEAIFAASMVSRPFWTSWMVQHNTVWVRALGHINDAAHRIIAFKVRRLLYNEIKEMDRFVGFRGARMLGFCLNVLGLKLTDRHKGFQREFYPLQAAAVAWIKANYKNLLAEHPEVAEVCLQGQISYDADKHRLVQTYSDRTGKEPPREFLSLD